MLSGTYGNTVVPSFGSSGIVWWIYLRHGFHIIQGCNPPDNIFLVALPFKLFGVKYIFDHHDAIPELYLSKYDNRGLLYKTQVVLEKLTYLFQ